MKLQQRTKVDESVSILWIVLNVISIISISPFFGNKNNDVFNGIILSVILISILIFFILDKQIITGNFSYFNLIIIGSYLLALPLLLSTKGNGSYHIWLIGGLIVSALINVNLGFIILLHHVFLASVISNYKTEQVIYLLIFGVVLCILSKHMKVRNLLKYIIVIVVSLDLVLQFVSNDLLINNIIKKEVVLAIILDVITVLGTYIISNFYESKMNNNIKKPCHKEEVNISVLNGQAISLGNNNSLNTMITTDAEVNNDLFDEIINSDFILLQQLNRYSRNLYERSLKVGKISYLAAKVIGANEKLTLAGGLYHDIGRICEGDDYVKEGLKLVKQYNMPNEIGDMIQQHNIKYNTPKSPEAAIIMLTISILATKDVLENSVKMQNETNKIMPMKKIVDNVFDMRLSKHSLDESGLTIHQFNQLKAFYTADIL